MTSDFVYSTKVHITLPNITSVFVVYFWSFFRAGIIIILIFFTYKINKARVFFTSLGTIRKAAVFLLLLASNENFSKFPCMVSFKVVVGLKGITDKKN